MASPQHPMIRTFSRSCEADDDALSRQTSREADRPVQARRLSPVVPPPPRSSAHANRPGSPVSSTPEAQAQVEFPPCIGLTQGPSDPNEQCLRPDASDNAMRRPQGLHQVVNQGWVAYFYCHCRCHAPRVAAGEARTSHSRQKRSAVKAAASEGRAPDRQSRRATATRRLLAPPRDAGKPYAREFELAFSCELAEERVSHSVSAGHPARDDETRRASGVRCSCSKRANAPRALARRSPPPTGSPAGFPARVWRRRREAAGGKIRPHRVPKLALS
jgi:hypothetical protein